MADELEAELSMAEGLWVKGVLSPRDYWKCLVVMASRFCQRDDTERALVLLNRCPPEYFQHFIFDDMKSDNPFAAETLALVARLEMTGILGSEEPVDTTSMARA